MDRPGYAKPCRCQLCQTLGGVYLKVAIEDSMKELMYRLLLKKTSTTTNKVAVHNLTCLRMTPTSLLPTYPDYPTSQRGPQSSPGGSCQRWHTVVDVSGRRCATTGAGGPHPSWPSLSEVATMNMYFMKIKPTKRLKSKRKTWNSIIVNTRRVPVQRAL